MGGWNTDLIKEIVTSEEANTIINLPLSQYRQADKLIWRAAPNGLFTVWSAYYMEKVKMDSSKGEGSCKTRYEQVWKSIWSLRVLNACKVFLWCACANILPTKEKLMQRKVVPNNVRLFCLTEKETVTHILWECNSSSDVWGVCDAKIQKSGVVGMDFIDVVANLLMKWR